MTNSTMKETKFDNLVLGIPRNVEKKSTITMEF